MPTPRALRLALASSVAVVACGGNVAVDRVADAGASTTTTPITTTTTIGAGGAAPTTITTTTTATGAGGVWTGNGGAGTGAGGQAATGTYGAILFETNVERVALYEPDPDRDLCYRVVLASLGGAGVGNVEVTPPGLVVERIEALKGAGSCASCMLQQGGFAATDAKGTITLGGGGVPGTIAASMNALFGNAPSFVPMSVDLVTPPVPVVPCAH